MNIAQAKTEVLYACKRLTERGLTVGTAGNISARAADDGVFVITPTSLDYDGLTAADLVTVDFAGGITAGRHKPSIEVSMHQEIYSVRKDVQAIVHTHSLFAGALASCKEADGIPPYDIETVFYLGGHINIAAFAPPGTKELARHTVAGLGTNAAVLMRNHGAVGVGVDMKAALTACEIVERSCQALFFARLFGGVQPVEGEFLRAAMEKSLAKRGVSREK